MAGRLDALEAFVADAVRQELLDQGDCSAIEQGRRVYCGFSVDPDALARAALEARKRWHRRTSR